MKFASLMAAGVCGVLLVIVPACSGEDSSPMTSGGGGGASNTTDSATTASSGGGGQASGGAGGATGSSSGGGGSATGTPGCGLPVTDIVEQVWVERQVEVGGAARSYWFWLPQGYDPSHEYPIVYQFHGCSAGRQSNNVPVQDESGDAAIHVRGAATGECWDTSVTGVDLPYVDAIITDVEQAYCVNTRLRFASGYSSGSFMAHRVACVRGSMFRGVATIAGGQAGSGCTGDVAALLMHDADDNTVNISQSEQTRDAYLAANGCDIAAARAPFEPAPCEQYAGCEAGLPVVWCQTSGKDHDRQDSLAAPAFWKFFTGLSPR